MDSRLNQFNVQLGNAAQPPDATRNHHFQPGERVMESSPEPGLASSPAEQPIQASADKPAMSPWRWLFSGLVLCCALGSMAAMAFLWLTSLPPRTNCEEISPLSADIDRLYCAQAAAESGELSDLMDGLKLVESWSPENPLHNEAQRWMEEWSESVLRIARQKMAASDKDGAIALANRVPKSSPLYTDAQAMIAQWQENWQIDEAIYARAQAALKQQDWTQVSQHILELSESPYEHWNSDKVNELSNRVLLEKKSRQILAEAKRRAAGSTPEDLRAALNLAKTLDNKTYTWTDAQPTLAQWGETLLTVGFNRWREARLPEAIAYAEAVTTSSTLKAEAEHLIQLSQARQLALGSSTNWRARPKHVWKLMEAVSAAQQIPQTSRFYAQAQESLASWQAQLDATTQLQYAQVLADLGQRDALQQAIAQAKQIDANHPRRLQAQTLVAHWQREVQRVEDQPYLLVAQQLAKAGTIDQLKLAIAEAGKVEPGRVLRDDAQGLIYDWTQQIQVLEDQPLLAEADRLAQQGNLTAAIRAAAQIPYGRALYGEAQAAIGAWQSEITRAELARTQSTQRNATNSATRSAEPEDDSLNELLRSEPAATQAPVMKMPKVERIEAAPPLPLPPLPPRQATRAPQPDPPFVLDEQAPLYEEPPARRVEYDADDIPLLIRRRADRPENSEPVVNEPPIDESPTTSDVFPPLDDASLFEPPAEPAPPELAPPDPEVAPVQPEPFVDQRPSSNTEASNTDLLPSHETTTESALPEPPLSMEPIEKDISTLETTTYPVSMNYPENEIITDSVNHSELRLLPDEQS